jgi:hypothetical protein
MSQAMESKQIGGKLRVLPQTNKKHLQDKAGNIFLMDLHGDYRLERTLRKIVHTFVKGDSEVVMS